MIWRKFIESIVYSHLWISIAAVSLISQTLFLIQGSWHIHVISGLVFGCTLLIYSMHRLIGLSKLREIKALLSFRYQIIGRSHKWILFLLYLGSAIAIACFFQLKTSTQIAMIIPGILSILYVLPLLSKRKRLRDISIIKIFLIAFVWGTVAVIIPCIEFEKPIDSSLRLLFAEKTLFIFAITLPFDIRDLKVDQTFGTKTIPLLLGINKTKILGQVIILISALFVVFNSEIYSTTQTIALVFGYVIILYLLHLTNQHRKDLFYSFGLDGTIILQTALLLISG
ncbi:MAG: UbiA family prenyltransferase [Bacteroidia bacterium]|nr:UbiA family prenyltransferase [Bacteroidia bacterium]